MNVKVHIFNIYTAIRSISKVNVTNNWILLQTNNLKLKIIMNKVYIKLIYLPNIMIQLINVFDSSVLLIFNQFK